MKRSGEVLHLLSAFAAIFLAAFCAEGATGVGESKASPADKIQAEYEWVLALPPGTGRFPEMCGEGHWPMAIVPLVALDDKLWMVSQKTAWSSSDGIRWNAQPKTDWGPCHGAGQAFFNKKMWMLGGMRTWDDFRNDVWHSSDGRDWKQATPAAAWSARRNQGVLVFQNKMWVLGGAVSSGRPDQVPDRFLNDVWSTEDGVQWTPVTDQAPWSARDGHVSLVFDEKMWVVGGAGHRDVWNSVDGRNWTQVTANAGWSARHSNGCLAFDGNLWVFGGRGLNDVWRSPDGASWKQAAAEAPWSPRTTIHSVVFNHKLWIYGGKTGREDSWSGDVWSMARAGVGTGDGK